MSNDRIDDVRDARPGEDPDDRTPREQRAVVDARTIRFIRAARRAAGQASVATDSSVSAGQILHPG